MQRIDFGPPHRTLLVTAHRRENLGAPLADICHALHDLLTARKDLQVVFPVHLNPEVRATVWSILGDIERVRLIDPLDYLDFVHVMRRADVIVTDSGGVQEEAPTGRPPGRPKGAKDSNKCALTPAGGELTNSYLAWDCEGTTSLTWGLLNR